MKGRCVYNAMRHFQDFQMRVWPWNRTQLPLESIRNSEEKDLHTHTFMLPHIRFRHNSLSQELSHVTKSALENASPSSTSRRRSNLRNSRRRDQQGPRAKSIGMRHATETGISSLISHPLTHLHVTSPQRYESGTRRTVQTVMELARAVRGRASP